MFTTVGSLVRLEQGVERKRPFSSPLCSWYQLVWCLPVTRDLPMEFPWEGQVGKESSCNVRRGQTCWICPANPSELWEIKILPPKMPFPVSSFGFIRFIGNLPQVGNLLLSGDTPSITDVVSFWIEVKHIFLKLLVFSLARDIYLLKKKSFLQYLKLVSYFFTLYFYL